MTLTLGNHTLSGASEVNRQIMRQLQVLQQRDRTVSWFLGPTGILSHGSLENIFGSLDRLLPSRGDVSIVTRSDAVKISYDNHQISAEAVQNTGDILSKEMGFPVLQNYRGYSVEIPLTPLQNRLLEQQNSLLDIDSYSSVDDPSHDFLLRRGVYLHTSRNLNAGMKLWNNAHESGKSIGGMPFSHIVYHSHYNDESTVEEVVSTIEDRRPVGSETLVIVTSSAAPNPEKVFYEGLRGWFSDWNFHGVRHYFGNGRKSFK